MAYEEKLKLQKRVPPLWWLKKLMVIGITVFFSSLSSAQTAPNLTMCALEGQTCNVTGAVVAAYGADTRWNVRVMNGAFACGGGSFGDPAPGTGKQCLVAPLGVTRPCGVEGQSCALPEGAVFAVIYGSDSRWSGKTYSKAAGAVACGNGEFGDPAPGTGKSCGVAVIWDAKTAPSLAACAVEGQTCNSTGLVVAAYGADTRWIVRVMNGAFACGNGTFGDPAPGAGKQCAVAPVASPRPCGVEGQSCALPALPDGSMFAVVYGTDARWAGKAYPKSVGAVACGNGEFGDPAPGAGKSCGVTVIPGGNSNAVMQQGTSTSGQDLAAVDEPTEFFWKGSYGRGVGTPVDACPAGKTQRGALCYDNCRAGYSDMGTLTCSTVCPSGYTDTGAICHFDGEKSYSPVHWDRCKDRAPGWLGGGCIGGWVEDGCRGGYSKVGSVCWANLSVPPGMSGSAWDPTKGTYNLSPDSMVCGGGKQQDAGLCYTPCRDGYKGVGPVCWAPQPQGYVDCGFGYAMNSMTCGFLVTDQVIGVLSLVKDACTMTEFPGVSQACAMGGSAYMKGKALAKMGVKSVGDLASNAALAAKASKRAKNMMAAMQKAQPIINKLVSSFAEPIKSLAGKSIKDMPEFAAYMAKVGAKFKEPDTLVALYGVAQTLRSAAEEPPFKLSGTPTEQAFKVIRDISAHWGMAVALSTLVFPGFEDTPPGQVVVTSADVLGVVAAYLYTVQGQ